VNGTKEDNIHDDPSSDEIKKILEETKRIAIVGLSPKKERDSNKVASYLKEHGYEIIPVNPGQKEILGEKCYRSLEDIPFEVDMVDLFVRAERISPVVDQAIEKEVKVIWMQLGVVHEGAAEKAVQKGIKVVMDRCVKMEHEKLIKRTK
jgi:predicted CoA-binding protein